MARVVYGREALMHQVRALRKVQPKLGGRKLYHMLTGPIAELGMNIGRDQFFEFLRWEGLLLRKRHRRARTTMSRHRMPTYPDLVKGLRVTAPGQVWVSDITYWAMEEGFYYIFLITDACSHKIIGHHVATGLDGAHALTALRMAVRTSPHPLKGIIHHSDRGSQYCYARYVNVLRKQAMRISMTETSDPRDNAVAERINGILKNELLSHQSPQNITQGRVMLEEAVAIYNEQRPHMSIDLVVPAKAHQLDHRLKQRWRNYYQPVNPKPDVDQLATLPQD